MAYLEDNILYSIYSQLDIGVEALRQLDGAFTAESAPLTTQRD